MSDHPPLLGVYGAPPQSLVQIPSQARQLSPLHPGATDLATAAPGSYASIVMQAPPGTLERRYAMAQALIALTPDAQFTVTAPKDKGGLRIAKELAAFGCTVSESSKSHHRICATRRPVTLTDGLDALKDGALRLVEPLGLWSQPGVFSWDRIDPGSDLLAARIPPLQGRGADLGCGVGYLALRVLQAPSVERLDLIDFDRRALDAAQRNVIDPRAHFQWADATASLADFQALDFVVMNPPFHSAATEDKALGQAFIRAAAKLLRRGGVCWLVANRHLPYEAVLSAQFKSVRLDHEAAGYKVFEAKA